MDIKNMYKQAEQLKEKLSLCRPLTQGEVERLKEDFIVNFTYNSNAIEGSTLTLDETAIVIQEGITIGGKSVKEHMEAIGHRDAYLFVESLVREKISLSEKVIKDIHSLVLMDRKEDAGIYRRLPVTITGTGLELPQPYLIQPKMEELIESYHGKMSEMNIIERTAKFHLLFESIHPFIDGNGRTGRLIMNLELMKEGYPPIDVKFTDRLAYIQAFRQWNTENDSNAMETLVANYVIERLDNYLQMLDIVEENEQKTQIIE